MRFFQVHRTFALTERKSLVGFGTRQGLRSPITSRTCAVSEPSSTMSSTLVPTILEASRIQPLIVDGITQKPTEAGAESNAGPWTSEKSAQGKHGLRFRPPRMPAPDQAPTVRSPAAAAYQTMRGRTTG